MLSSFFVINWAYFGGVIISFSRIAQQHTWPRRYRFFKLSKSTAKWRARTGRRRATTIMVPGNHRGPWNHHGCSPPPGAGLPFCHGFRMFKKSVNQLHNKLGRWCAYIFWEYAPNRCQHATAETPDDDRDDDREYDQHDVRVHSHTPGRQADPSPVVLALIFFLALGHTGSHLLGRI